MNPNLFDQISRRFGEQRLSRRTAVATSLAVGAAAVTCIGTAAQDATPAATPEGISVAPAGDAPTPTQLFVQSFQSGSIAPSASEFGTHRVTLDQGLGQTIVFTDRPSREVFTSPTPAFLDGLGFDADNPPNAAIVIDAGDGTTDIAVVELFNPTYDEVTHTATYDIAVLANWQNDLEMGFQQEPADLANVAPHFGATHLFIDGCRGTFPCVWWNEGHPVTKGQFYDIPATYWVDPSGCHADGTADTHTLAEVRAYWTSKCNETFPACENRCTFWW
ncbi:hypothetical protein BH23CHL4_BH23CHL4_15880 [soil metagenome]